jgi:hypothetical protein
VADDAAAPDRLREDMIAAANTLLPGLEPERAFAAGVLHMTALKALAAVDKVLALHRPRQLYGLAETMHGRQLCAHDPDYDGDAHFEGDDGLWYCKDKPTVKVCASCADGTDGDSWAEWPCATYSAVLAGLTGEAVGDAKG